MSPMGTDFAKASPAVAVVSTHIMGVNWPDIAYILTAIHLALLIGFKIWKEVRDRNSDDD